MDGSNPRVRVTANPGWPVGALAGGGYNNDGFPGLFLARGRPGEDKHVCAWLDQNRRSPTCRCAPGRFDAC